MHIFKCNFAILKSKFKRNIEKCCYLAIKMRLQHANRDIMLLQTVPDFKSLEKKK